MSHIAALSKSMYHQSFSRRIGHDTCNEGMGAGRRSCGSTVHGSTVHGNAVHGNSVRTPFVGLGAYMESAFTCERGSSHGSTFHGSTDAPFMGTPFVRMRVMRFFIFFPEAHQTRSNPRRTMYCPAIDSVRTGVRLRAHEVPSTCRCRAKHHRIMPDGISVAKM